MNFLKIWIKFWNSIAGKFALTVFLVSIFAAIVATVFLMYINVKHAEEDYVRMLDRVHLSFDKTLLTGLWLGNREIIDTVLTGFASLPGVEEVAVIPKSGEGIRKGQVRSRKILKHEHSLIHTYRGEEVPFGNLSITIGLDRLFNKIYHDTRHLIFIITLVALGAGALAVVLFNWLVGRHLRTIAAHSASLNFDKLDSELSLNRRKAGKSPDELEHIVKAFNTMCKSLRLSFQEIQSKESMFEDIVTNSSDMIFRLDSQGNIIYANPVADEQMDDKLRKTFQNIVSLNHFPEFYTKKTPITLPVLVESPNNDPNVCSYELRLSPELSSQGDLESIIGIARDVTLHNRKAELLRAIFDHAPVLMMISDITTGACFDLNETFIESTGYTRAQAIGSTTVELGFLCSEERVRIKEILQEEGVVKDLEINAVKASGKDMICLYNGQIITVSGEQKLLSLAHDVTLEKQMLKEQEALRRQLIQATKMEAIGTLAGGIAHDFNNILTAILGYGQMVLEALEDQGEESPTSEHMHQVLLAGKRAADLVKQILTFSRQDEEEFLPYALQHIIKEVVKLLRSTTPVTIELHCDIDTDTKSANMDPSQIHQLLMNILTNSRQAIGQEHGKISITLREECNDGKLLSVDGKPMPPGSYHRLTIEDNGKGMGPEVKARLFDPFFTTKPKGEGTGMGMAVCHGIISSHKGTILVESELGKGTIFDIYLPVCATPKRLEPAELEKMDLEGTERIMLVDDEKPIVSILEQSLNKYGYQTVCFSDGAEALDYFAHSPDSVDLIITDMAMPIMTGVEMSRKILEKNPNFPIILCTGYSGSINEETATELGIRSLKLKPLIPRELLLAMRNIFDNQSKRTNN